ncbi:serine/threonine-protein kinase [Streptomyces johnsoniae]|uniref:Serine/threonine-protein kinase n=1 Tax=Streptomyces johnsoniae TaxID=3075532 RepID=A0ABU2S5L4_9ACTN|nr:serine/threonine-protein kinase [Streptomyces sp. DSM 41886]MDT0444264.1 serine/threonine-protein kinase [Streptomyces sp. DSM 41886]
MGEHRDAAGWAPAPVAPLQSWDPRDVSGYQLQGRLGSGGMGTVYLSRSRGGQPVALKVVHADLAGQPRFRKRFQQEVHAARRVRGRYLAPVVDSNTEGPVPWLATEYIRGPALSQVLNAGDGGLDPRTVLRLVAGIASALADIHAAGVIHRDLKPGNVMLAGDGPVVIDFGIARAADATSLTGTRTRVGTPGFMAPEQAVGSEITAATDVFALGLTACVAAAAQHPYGDGPPDAMLYRIAHTEADLDACPAELRGLVGPCLRRAAADRPSAAEVLALCRELAAEWGLDDSPLPAAGWLPFAVRDPVPDAPTLTGPPPPPAAVPRHPDVPRFLPAPVPAPLHHATVPGPGTPPPAAGTRRDSRYLLVAALAVVLVAGLGVGAVLAGVWNGGDDGPGGQVGGEYPADGGTDDKDGASGGGEPDTQEPDTQEPDNEEPDNEEPEGGTAAGGIPDFFLGTWTSTPVWDGEEHTRVMEIQQAAPGETAMTLTADGPGYHCEFAADLLTVAGETVELTASEVTVAEGACQQGDPTVLVPVGDQLRRDNTDGQAPLTYTRTG